MSIIQLWYVWVLIFDNKQIKINVHCMWKGLVTYEYFIKLYLVIVLSTNPYCVSAFRYCECFELACVQRWYDCGIYLMEIIKYLDLWENCKTNFFGFSFMNAGVHVVYTTNKVVPPLMSIIFQLISTVNGLLVVVRCYLDMPIRKDMSQ